MVRLIVLTCSTRFFYVFRALLKHRLVHRLMYFDDQFKLFPGQAHVTMHLCRAQSGAGSPWGSAGAGSSASLLSDSTELTAMQQDGSPTEGRQPQAAAQPVEQQQQQTVQQQGGASQRISAEQAPQQLQPVPEAAAAAASANDAQRRQAHVPGQVHVTLKVLKRR